MTKKFTLQNLLASTTDVEIKHPYTGEPTGITVTLLPVDSPKIQSKIAMALGNLPKTPTEDSPIGDKAQYNVADDQLNRDIIIMRVVGSNDEGLSTPEQREVFFHECDIKIVQQLMTDGADRALYFRQSKGQV